MKQNISPRRSLRSLRPLIEPLEARIAPAANAWIAVGSGNWNTPGNWSDGVPTADDVVTINPAGTLTITVDSGVQAVASLSMPGDDALAISGGSLAISSASVLHNLALGGSGSLFANAAVSLTGAGSFSGSAILGGSSVVTNNGTLGITGGEPDLRTELVNANGATIQHGSAFLDLEGAAAKLRLVSGGLYEAVNTSSGFGFRAFNGTPGVFVETGGVFRHNTPNGATFDVGANVPFNVNGGTLQNTGVVGTALNLNGIGTFTNATLVPSGGTTINFSGNNNTVVGTLTGSGAGVVNLATGQLHATAAGATLNFPAGLFNLSGTGSLSGPGFLTNTGTIQITSGEPDLATELLNLGTIKHGSAFLDLEGAAARLRLVSGGLYEAVNTSSSFGFRAFNGTPGVFVETGGVFRHNSSNGATFDVGANVPFDVNGGTLQNTGVAGTALNLNGIGAFTNATLVPSVGTTINFSGNNNTVVGTLTGSGAGVVNLATGQLHATAAGATLNFPAGLFNLSGTGSLSGPGVFTNTGLIQITSGEPDLATELLNLGTIKHGSAFLDLEGAAARLRLVPGGLYEAVNTSSSFGFRAFNGTPGVFVESGGVFRHNSSNGATFDVGANVPFDVNGGTLQNTGVAGTALNLNGIGTFTNATLVPSVGTTINFSGNNNTVVGTLTGSGAGVVNLATGQLHATAAGATLNFPAGLFNLSGTGSLSGPGNFTNTGTIQITSGEPDLATDLVNAGTIRHSSAFLDLVGAGKLRVIAGGLYEAVNTSSNFGFRAFGGTTGVFVEAGGVLRHNSPNGATFNVGADVPFTVNGGTLQNKGVAGTALILNGIGTFTNASFAPSLNTAINFSGDNNTIIGTLTGTGTGKVNLSTGQLHAAAAGATLNFPAGMFDWSGTGSLNGPGIFTNKGAIQIASGEPNLVTELVNAGTIQHFSAFLDLNGSAAKLRVVSGGVYESVNTSSNFGFRATNGTTGVFVEAAATFRHNTPNGAHFAVGAGTPFSNLGSVVVANGALNFTAAPAQISGPAGAATLTGGAWEVASGATLNLGISGLATNAATIVVRGTGSFTGLAALATNSGSLSLLDGADLTKTTTLTNTGALTLSAGTVLTTPAFTQTLTGSTTFELGGTTAAQIGRLAVTGAATLGGTANFQIVNGFAPAAGQSLVPATFGSKNGNFTNITGLGLGRATIFEVVNTPTALTLNSLVNAADLAAQSVTTPVNTNAGANIALSYTVQNVSANPTLATAWTDTVYLSLDGTVDSSDIVLTRVAHSGAVAGGGSYTENLNVPLIGALPANYKILVVADSQGRVPDPARANNFVASAGTFALDIPALTPGAAFNGAIRNGQDLYFRIALPDGQTPTFTFTGAVAGGAEIYQAASVVPTRASFEDSAFTPGSTVQRISGAITVGATYYILLHGRENSGAGQTFSLVANSVGFDLDGTSVAGGPNIGRVTTTLSGTQFSPATTFTLVPAVGASRAAQTVYFHDSRSADATFDLTGLAAGSYNIVANNGGPTDTLTNAFTVTNGGTPGALKFNLSSPRYVRPPFGGLMATLTYENTGSTDLDAPLFHLVAENARLRLADEGYIAGTFTQDNGVTLGVFELLGVSGGLAGVLSPGEKATIEVIFEPINAATRAVSNLQALVAGNSSAPIDFESLKADLQPVGVANDAWDAVFGNFKTAAGTTIGSYRAMLIDNANYLGQFGKVSPAATRLVDFELDQADVLGAIVDRYELGTLGRGSASPFGERLSVNASGDVTLKDGGQERTFVKLANGTYQGTGVDFGKLTQSTAGVFTLDEGDGNGTVFRASDGRIDFAKSANGNRLTATWNGSGQLTALTNSLTGDVASYTYNAQGRIATDTDPVGRVTTYGYDASGEHLTSVTNAQGTTTFTYIAGQGAAREHAVATSTGPDGVTTTYTYDALGRVTQSSLGTGAQAIAVSFTYDSAGRVTATDLAGRATTTFYVEQGAIARTIDPLGQVTSVTYDSLGRFVSATDPSGAKTRTSLDGEGLLNGVMDASRAKTQIDIGGEFQRLQSVTDPGGDMTRLSYDAKGNLTETLYPDGFANHYDYDAAGRVIGTTDANGARTGFTYSAAGLLTLRTLPDGSTVAYTYDAHRNLLTGTDAEGTTTLTYDSADRLTSIAYPNGKTITNTYDAAGRRTSVADQTGFTVRYSYDALGRLDVVRDTANALLVDYDYNTLGQIATETRGNGATTGYTYDTADRVTTITHRDAANAVTGFFNYTYDTHDRIKTVTDATGTTTYTYDITGQIVGVALPGGRTIAYGYDVEGNRTTVADSVNGTENYLTNNADQYTAAGAETLAYDYAGRVIASTTGGVTTSYTYDLAGRLAGIVSPGSVITFDYDALGNRIGKTENGVRTDFANDPAGLGTVFGEYAGAATQAHYARGLGIAARTDSAGAAAYYHFDAIGNTALLTGAGGTSVASYTYLPFGKVASQTGASAQPFTYNGGSGVQDEAGDLYSMGARTYDAGLGRFTSRDPIGFGGGDTNLYRFVNNDPVNSTDPSGLRPSLGGFGNVFRPFTTSVAGNYLTLNAFRPAGLIGDVGLVLGGSAGGIPSATTITTPFTALTSQLAAENSLVRFVNTTANAVTNPGANLPAVYDKAFATQQLLGKPIPPALSKGAQVLNFLKPVAKFLAPVAKVAGPVSTVLTVIDLAQKHQDAYDYYKDAGTYGKFNPDETDFSRDYYRTHGDNALLNELIQLGINDRGLSERDARLDAIAFLKKLDNDYERDQLNAGGGKAGANTKTTSEVVRPSDPNNIIGPAGAGADPVPDIIAPGQTRFDGFVSGGGNFPYRIEFENIPSATAPAQVVKVTQTLDADLDLATFAFTGFGFGANNVTASGTSFHTIYDATATLGVLVQIDADLNTLTGALDVTYTSLDPATNDVPLDPFTGFLPPDDATGRGDGFLTYNVQPKAALANGTAFTGLASIVFDTEDAIATPTVTNTLDTAAPTATVSALPASTNRSTFVVHWTGADNVGGSGLAGITLSFTDNGGPLQTATVANADGGFRFPGVVGHTYALFSQAVDNVGNSSALPLVAEETITVVAPTFVNVGASKTFVDADGDRYTIRKTGPGAVKIALLDPDGDGRGAIDFLQVDGSTAATAVSVTVVKGASGNGRVDIGDVTVNGALKSFVARQSELVVNGFTATRAVGAIALGSVLQPDALLADPTIKVGGAASSALSVSAVIVADDFKLQTPGRLASFVARSIGDGFISARSIGTIQTNAGDLEADITSLIGIGRLTVKGGDLSGEITARSIGAVSVTGGDFSGEITSLTSATSLGVTPAIASLAISGGDFTGDLRVLGSTGAITVSALRGIGGNMTGGTINAARIASLIVGKNVSTSTILAGADLGADHALGGIGLDVDTFGRGAIGPIAIMGSVTSSVIGAGLNATDSIFDNGNDTIVAGIASRIAALTIRGTASADSYFAAGKFTAPVKIAGATVVPRLDPRFLVV